VDTGVPCAILDGNGAMISFVKAYCNAQGMIIRKKNNLSLVRAMMNSFMGSKFTKFTRSDRRNQYHMILNPAIQRLASVCHYKTLDEAGTTSGPQRLPQVP
jgi:hypothetical protein